MFLMKRVIWSLKLAAAGFILPVIVMWTQSGMGDTPIDSRKVYRLSGVPPEYDAKQLELVLGSRLWRKLRIRTLAPHGVLNGSSKPATFNFRNVPKETVPAAMTGPGHRSPLDLVEGIRLIIDDHFFGFTVLHHPRPEVHEFE
jgi:hypothetical protein